MESPTLLARAQLMLKMAASVVSLKIPAQVPGPPGSREVLVDEAALMACVRKLIAATPPGRRWLVAFAHAIVEAGREQGADFEEIIAEISDATKQAVYARVKLEAQIERKAAEAAKPSIIKPN